MVGPSYANWVEVPVIDLSDDEEVQETSPPAKRRCLFSPSTSGIPRQEPEGPRHALGKPQSALRCLGTAIFPEANADFLRHLEDQGFAVLQGILGSTGSCQAFLHEFWTAMKAVAPSIDPTQQSTWNFPKGFRGIVTSYGLPQAGFAWSIRAHPRVHTAFARIFGTTDLVVSLDAIIAEARPAKTKLQPWLHKDQHPSHAGLSIQAVYTHFGSASGESGTCVVPGSHRVTYDWERSARSDHVRAPEDTFQSQVLKPDVPPDSMIFFNSRLVHASQSGAQAPSQRPARLGVCVAYAPRARRSEATRRKKEKAYLEGKCSSHWPCDRFSLKPPLKQYQLLKGATSLPPPPASGQRLSLL